MTSTVEPERELVRRLLPLAVPAAAAAAALAALLGGAGAAVSATFAIAAVAAILVIHAASLAWASRISAAAVMIVGIGGYLVRIAVFTAGLLLLDRLAWFSAVAFVATFAPATLGLLILEMRLLGGRMQADLWYFRQASG